MARLTPRPQVLGGRRAAPDVHLQIFAMTRPQAGLGPAASAREFMTRSPTSD